MEIKRVPIDQVENWKDNPRNIKTEDMERLKKQILELGIYKPLIAYPEGGKYIILGGNMRLHALRELKVPKVDVSIIHPKDEAEKIKFSLSDNDRMGEYSEQQLAELVYPHIQEINLEDYKVDFGSAVSLKDLIDGIGPDGDEDIYSTDITIPTYEPKGDCPPVDSLIDRSKAEQLLAEIDVAELPQDITRFLQYAAERHAIFRFNLIAEYYCHATPGVQDLMERSALVIIDFQKAIENGFVLLTEKLGAIADQENFHER